MSERHVSRERTCRECRGMFRMTAKEVKAHAKRCNGKVSGEIPAEQVEPGSFNTDEPGYPIGEIPGYAISE